MVDGSILDLLLPGGLAIKLFIKGEDGFLRTGVDVSCSSASTAEVGGSRWKASPKERGWAASGCARGGFGSPEGVACATTARVDVRVGDSWVRLGDGVSGCHVNVGWGVVV